MSQLLWKVLKILSRTKQLRFLKRNHIDKVLKVIEEYVNRARLLSTCDVCSNGQQYLHSDRYILFKKNVFFFWKKKRFFSFEINNTY